MHLRSSLVKFQAINRIFVKFSIRPLLRVMYIVFMCLLNCMGELFCANYRLWGHVTKGNVAMRTIVVIWHCECYSLWWICLLCDSNFGK